MTPSTLLDRILWTQLARVVHGSPPEWEPESASARAIRGVLAETELDPEESGIVERWDAGREGSRMLFDRLLQTRVNRAVRAGLRVEAERLGLAEPPKPPKVLIVREGAPEEELAKTAPGRASPKKTVVEFLAGASADVADLAPGAKLDELVDLLVLANEAAADELRTTMGASATVARADQAPEIDLLLAAPTPSIQVFDIERELARLEEVLRNAIPPEKRPAKTGTWSFGKDLTGESLGGKYRIMRLKGKGAFKTVYEGEDEMLGARVAVAVLNPKGARSPRALEHFQDEAKKLTTLDHENIVRWITFDRTADGLNYFVMEYLDGEELEELLRREGRLAPKRVARILLQVVAALKRAHKAGRQGSLLHLDLKPENVFVLPPLAPGEPERVKVIDFGIGQHVGAEIRAAERPELRSLYDLPAEDLGKSIGSLVLPEDDEDAQAPEDSKEAGSKEAETKEGAPAPLVRRKVQRARGGTLLYASPEQCKHLAGHKDIENLDGRSDLYSLGVMAFRMLTGQYPFVRIATAFEAIENHLKAAPRKVGSLGIKIPRDLAAFVDRCLVKDREKRWKDANEAYAALERIVHPRVSAVKVVVPIAGIVAVGLGALYFARDSVVNQLTLVDPEESVSAGVVSEVFLGPKKPTKVLRLESEADWDREDPPDVSLSDATSRKPLTGWKVRWAEGDPGAIEIARLDDATTATARVELDGGRWQGRLVLRHLGQWKIESVAASGHAPTLELDPHGRSLELEVGGDPEGRDALKSIEVFLDGTLVGQSQAPAATARGARAFYTGPALDTLFTKVPHEAELRVVAHDRAGQTEEDSVGFRIAGEPPRLAAGTSFVVSAEPDAAKLPYPGETQVLLPGYALRIAATAPAQARVFLDGESEAVVTRDIRNPAKPLIVTLEELRIAGAQERLGKLRIAVDDAQWVDRLRAQPDSRELSFQFRPESPQIKAMLTADSSQKDLLEQAGEGSSTAINAGTSAKLVVTPPLGTPLWIEASCASEQDGAAGFQPMTRTGSGPFELELALPREGTYRITVQKYTLDANGQRGPQIPPEHVFPIEVDRKAPVVALELEGAQGTDADGLQLFKGAFTQRIVASVTESVGLAELAWTLRQPGGQSKGDELEAGTRVVLPALDEFESADGRYELECVARDRAGNSGSKKVAWQVARSGPTLELLEPRVSSTDRRWLLGDGTRWNMQVRTVDPNGVAAVRARVVYQGKRGPELELVQSSGDSWELREADRQTAFFWWTGKKLEIELSARDGAGIEASIPPESGIVPELGKASDYVIAPRDRRKETMVEIEAEGSYVFGGRAREATRPWNVEIENLPSFYLDTREVTRGEFLVFVRAAEGYANPRWWPAGAGPEERRKRELADMLAGDAERSATGIAWPEAYAYAAWRGKRLPTLVEWEYAVRGPDYSQRPARKTQPGAADDWPANLCAGAREWTATPEDLVAEAYDFPTQCRRHPELLCPRAAASSPAPASASLGTPLLATSHWTAGPRPGGAADWTAKETCPDAPGADDVGFRCALDVEAAHSRLDEGQYVIVE